jgi:hypothetical protein
MLRLLPKSALAGGAASASSPAADAASPASPGADSGGGDAAQKRGAAATSKAGGGNSKAATVESAIEYIKSLQVESAAMSERAAQHEREVEALRRRVREMARLCGENGVEVEEADETEEADEIEE